MFDWILLDLIRLGFSMAHPIRIARGMSSPTAMPERNRHSWTTGLCRCQPMTFVHLKGAHKGAKIYKKRDQQMESDGIRWNPVTSPDLDIRPGVVPRNPRPVMTCWKSSGLEKIRSDSLTWNLLQDEIDQHVAHFLKYHPQAQGTPVLCVELK